MIYAYLFIDNLNGHSYENGINELKASITTLKKNISHNDSIVVFNNETSGKNIDFFKKQKISHRHISLSRKYKGSDNINPISILVEKIICLMNFDENEDIVLMDIDTAIVNQIPENYWDNNHIVFDNIEYPIMQWRNLDKVLPQIPWKDYDINFDSSFMMYNTGVIYIPKRFRKEVCEKALKIVDYLNDNFEPEDRCGNKLDEQIALSIVAQDCFGKYGYIKLSNEYIYHYWAERQNNIKWWESESFISDDESTYSSFIESHYPSCLDLVNKNIEYIKDKVIIDVGSNIGLFAKSIAETTSYKHIHLFEPSREYFEESKKILKDFKNITFNNFGLSDRKNVETLHKSKDDNIGWNTLYKKDPVQDDSFLQRMDSESVEVVVLDEYYSHLDSVDFIKIDVEGYERQVLEGSWNIIKKFKPYLLIEVSWGKNHPEWDLNKNTYEKLFSLGYERVEFDNATRDILFRPVKSKFEKLPVSIGILSWNSSQTLRNTLDSYKKNGLLDLVNDVTIFFQEVSEDDKKIANEYKIPFIGIDQNIGIGEALIKLTELARTDNILLLEHDWELIENKETTFERLSDGLELINNGYDVVRYRHRRNPGYPLYTYQAYKGKELNNYQPIIELESPHLMESIHWIENPEIEFPDKISKEKNYFTSTSRWSNFTNNPCIYRKEFYLNTIYPFKGKGQHLENDISYWWARQNFKIAWGEGLFMHNDIQKHGAIENISYLPDKKQNSIAFIFAHRDTDKWSTPLSVVNEFKRLGWKTEIYSLFDSNDNYTDDNIHKLLKTNPDIIMHLDWGQHTSPILDELRKTGAYCVMESGDDPQRFGNNSVKASWFDLILSPDIRCVEEYRRMGHNAEWWTHFSDTNTYFPLDEQPTYVAVCSRGMGNDAYIIDSLAQRYPNEIKNQNGFWGEEHNKFLNSANIILQQSRYGEITRRIFEGMSCKKLVLADKLDPSTSIQDLFVDGEDIVFYEGEEDCLNKVVYYSNNQEEAKKIAESGYQKVLNNHTQIQRVEFIINKWKSVVK